MELTPENFEATHPTPIFLRTRDINTLDGVARRHNADVVFMFELQVDNLKFNGYPEKEAIQMVLQRFDIPDLIRLQVDPTGEIPDHYVSVGRYAPPGYTAVARPK